jgi:hypothetical protein
MVLGGFFTTYNGVARSLLTRINADASLDTTFDPGTGASMSAVRALALQTDGKVLIGGAFSTYNGVSRPSIARVNGDLFVNWPAGDATNKTIQLPIVDDSAIEGNETLTLTLTSLKGGASTGVTPTQTLTIIDNDAAPTPTASPTATPGGSATPTPTASPTAVPSTLGNISTRLRVETGDNALIGGFIITGTQQKKVLVRAIGPSLSQFFSDTLSDPTLELRNGDGTLLDSNDNWITSANKQAIMDTGIPPSNDFESAIIATLPANGAGYTAIVRGANNSTGIGVVEAYDLDRSVDSKLANISTRGFVSTGDNVLIAGMIVLGTQSQKVLVRAIGPSLPLGGKIADPTLELRDQNGGLLEANDNWVDSPNKQAIMDILPPPNDKESAIVRTLPPASYTAIVRGVNDTTGIAVVEVYALQ